MYSDVMSMLKDGVDDPDLLEIERQMQEFLREDLTKYEAMKPGVKKFFTWMFLYPDENNFVWALHRLGDTTLK